MKKIILSMTTLVFASLAATAIASPQAAITGPTLAANPAVTGDYIESRSLSVYAGACHYGGEAVTEGKEALLAWRFREGAWNGQSLKGLSAVAVVNGPENLALNPDGHHTILYVDANATPEQRSAVAELLAAKYKDVIGQVVEVNAAPVTFQINDRKYNVRVTGAAYIAADRYPCHKCVMPHQVWYQPFVPVKDALVARALRTEFKASVPNFTQWSKEEANSAFVGEFTL